MEVLVGILVVVIALLVGVIVFVLRGSSPKVSDDSLKTEFQALSQTALRDASEQFLDLAEQRFARLAEAGSHEMQGNRMLIDQQLQNMKNELGKVTDLVQKFEKDREAKFGQLTTEIRTIGEQAAALTSSTSTLRQALANSRSRGQWGERMAEDILRLMGFIEGVNYEKQRGIEGSSSRPDFVFYLPGESRINMDVKFPLDNYLRYVESESDTDKAGYQQAFLRDVRSKINEISSRDYIDPRQGTVDYVLLFIPNESVYSFIHESDQQLLDTALQKKVIWCSPLTLYCVLAVVRQAVENFAVEKASSEIISLMGTFREQWGKFLGQMGTLGNRLRSAQNAFDDLSGTRRRVLERPLEKIEELRRRRGLPVAELADEDGLAIGADGVLAPIEETSMEEKGADVNRS